MSCNCGSMSCPECKAGSVKKASCGGCGGKKIACVFLIIGGLNWGLTGLGMLLGSNLNVVNLIFGGMPTLEAIIYLIVGVFALVKLFGCPCKKCKGCKKQCSVESST